MPNQSNKKIKFEFTKVQLMFLMSKINEYCIANSVPDTLLIVVLQEFYFTTLQNLLYFFQDKSEDKKKIKLKKSELFAIQEFLIEYKNSYDELPLIRNIFFILDKEISKIKKIETLQMYELK